jgi:Protein of unknown function (DUF2934)
MADDTIDPDDPWRDPGFEQAVRDTAYFLWESDGRPAGREQDYWFRAVEQCLRQRRYDDALREEPQPGGRPPT